MIKSTVHGHHKNFVVSLEKSCGLNSSYTRYILYIHDDLTVAFLKNNNTVGHVPQEISRVSAGSCFLQKSGSEMTCTVSGGSVCLHI